MVARFFIVAAFLLGTSIMVDRRASLDVQSPSPAYSPSGAAAGPSGG